MKFISHLLTPVLIALLFCALDGPSVQAQTWPTRPITSVIGFGPGTGIDSAGRMVAEFI